MLFGNVRIMSTAKFCTQCGAKLPSDNKFCSNCGKSISDLGTVESQTENPVTQVKEELHLTRDGVYRRKKKTFRTYILLGCLTVLGGIASIVVVLIAVMFLASWALERERNKPYVPQPRVDCYTDKPITRCVKFDIPHEEKIVEFSKFISEEPEFRAVYYHRGAAYHELGQYEKALADYNQAVQMGYVAEHNLYGKLGHVHRELGNHKEALLSYEKHKELDPINAWPYHYIGMVYFDLEEYEKAIESWEIYGEMRQLRGEYQKYHDIHEWIGKAYLELGLFSKALESFNIAIEGNPNPGARLLKLKEEAESKIQK